MVHDKGFKYFNKKRDWMPRFDIIQEAVVAVGDVSSSLYLEELTVEIARMIYVAISILGLILWVTDYSKKTGRDLIFGALILAFLVECLTQAI